MVQFLSINFFFLDFFNFCWFSQKFPFFLCHSVCVIMCTACCIFCAVFLCSFVCVYLFLFVLSVQL